MKIYLYIIGIMFSCSVLMGQTISDLQKAQKLYEEYKTKQPELGINEIVSDSTISDPLFIADSLFRYFIKVTEDEKMKYFGYDFFSVRDSIRIWPNISAPENYILGPGDNLKILIWGRAQLNKNYIINRDGNIYDARIGLVSLEGKTLKEVRKILLIKFSEKINSLKGKEATSFIDVTIGKLKSINVHFVGHVKFPGIHLIHPLSDIMTGLLQAGGVDTTGSLRKIQIKRNGELIKEIDLYNFLNTGDDSEIINLQNNDVIVVPKRLSTVSIIGEVYKPGIFEALFTESIKDILSYSGGLKPNASTSLTLKRFTPFNKRINYSSTNQQDRLVEYNVLADIPIMDGDLLSVFPIPKLINHVSISGQVKNPRSYLLTDSLTVKDLLYRAGGVEDINYLKSIFLGQIEINRINPNSNENIVIKIDLNEMLTTKKYDDLLLQKDDHVVVHKNIYYSDATVNIDGEVYKPGIYSIEKRNNTLHDILNMAGGLTENAFTDGIIIYRDSTKLIWNDFNVRLFDGDSIMVPLKPFAVFVGGEVYNPGFVHFKNGRSLRNYIEIAGGIKPTGNRRDILLIYPNGNVRTNSLLPRKIVDGSNIIINVKHEKEQMDYGSFIRETISLATSIILTYVAIERIK